MRIKMKKQYKGGIGTFDNGKEYDLPKNMIECLPKDSFERISSLSKQNKADKH